MKNKANTAANSDEEWDPTKEAPTISSDEDELEPKKAEAPLKWKHAQTYGKRKAANSTTEPSGSASAVSSEPLAKKKVLVLLKPQKGQYVSLLQKPGPASAKAGQVSCLLPAAVSKAGQSTGAPTPNKGDTVVISGLSKGQSPKTSTPLVSTKGQQDSLTAGMMPTLSLKKLDLPEPSQRPKRTIKKKTFDM